MKDKLETLLLELISLIEEKEDNLKSIKRLTEEQAQIFANENFDVDLLNQNLDQKQKHIDVINELDASFEERYKLFKSYDNEFNKESKKYSPLIKQLQGYISSINAIIADIQKLEEENKERAALAFDAIKKDILAINKDKKAFSVYNKSKLNISGNTFDKSR